ncbi:hypothetical protein K435DRAFT_669248 [Dendrothele bispora CBS 962.96]|uniref:Ferric oxidoreductase domain-containing protein n=1 Tax=Dendrothele bispora (strain CBS 962.96) TaxID=1314807 RepID=A0A4V4HF90_DENBC|nr:hypothetical protein K435DRAFT_669248 [Dendrothele bispora CBS 962.96]
MDPSLAGTSRNSELRVLQTDSLPLSALTTLREPPMEPWSLIRSIESWLVLRGGTKFLFWLSWVLFHLLVFGLGFVSYQLSDNRVNARSLYMLMILHVALTSLVLHIDIIFILFPVCRNLISFLRSRMSVLNTIIPFDQAVTFHEATGWSMIFFYLIHIVFHEINFMKLVLRDPLITNRNGHTTTSRLGAFFTLSFPTGPGLKDWSEMVMVSLTLCKTLGAPWGKKSTPSLKPECKKGYLNVLPPLLLLYVYIGYFDSSTRTNEDELSNSRHLHMSQEY